MATSGETMESEERAADGRPAGALGELLGPVRGRLIPATLHYAGPNPLIDFDASSFVVSGTPRPGPAGTPGNPARRRLPVPRRGQSAQRMGQRLYENHPVCRCETDRCARIVASGGDVDLLGVLHPPGGAAPNRENIDVPDGRYAAIPAAEWSLAVLPASWDIRPSVMIGHAVGCRLPSGGRPTGPPGLDLDRSRPGGLGWWPVMSACRGARCAAPKE
ncbi:hypothetical protein [Streptomyces anulatus]|uniref:hypothetical protein n=1 Tax=Streptomyces anulatus TaxID=1892 RepID=UPI00363C2C53